MHRPSFSRRLAAFAGAALVLAACENPAGSREEPGIRVVSGAGTDTVMSLQAQPLVVEVRDSAGELRSGVLVRFDASTVRLNGADVPALLLSASTPDNFQPAVSTLTDGTGRAVVRVRLGRVATQASVALTAPTLGLTGTATYTINPGVPASLHVAPLDTAVYVGSSYTLRATTRDIWGNTIATLTPSITAGAASPVTVSGATVRGESLGRGTLTVAVNGLVSGAGVSVVPQGTLLAAGADGIYTFALDGSGFRRVAAMQGARSPRWFPGGQSFVFTVGLSHAWVSDMNGATRPLVQGANPLAAELWAHPSRDGQWVYFGGYDPNYRGYPYRVRADGTGLQLVPGFTVDDRTQSHPSTSPAGTRVAYFHEAPGDSRNVTLRILNMQTGQLELQDIAGHSPEWSHGDSIAYLDMRGGTSGSIRLMSSTGGGRRMLGNGPSYDFGIDWSPDDRWIAARDVFTNRLEVIQVSTGLRIPLPYSAGFRDPAWKP